MANNISKLNIGWYSFACCEDNTIMFAELLNDYFFDFKAHFNFIDAPVLSSNRDQVTPLDIVFVEGAANCDEHAETMKKLRQRSKKVIAIGSCACTGMPSAQRNTFDPQQQEEINFLIERFNFGEKVLKVADVIPIDGQVTGCPMDLTAFMNAVNAVLAEFGHQPITLKQ